MQEPRPLYERSRISARKNYKICPKCKGKGYYEENALESPVRKHPQFNMEVGPFGGADERKEELDNGAKGDDVEILSVTVPLPLPVTVPATSPLLNNQTSIPSYTTSEVEGRRLVGGRRHLQVSELARNILPDKRNHLDVTYPMSPGSRLQQSHHPTNRQQLDKRWSLDRATLKDMPLSPMRMPKSIARLRAFGSDTSINSEVSDLLHIEQQRDIGEPRDFLKQARIKLKSNNWDSVMSGLEDIAVLHMKTSSVEQGTTQAGSGNTVLDWETVGLAMTRLVASFHLQKTRSVRLSCQILRELFRVMRTTVHRPFDDAVYELMKRSSDTSRLVRWDAQQALDTMVSSVPVQFSTRAILNHAPRHKNPVVRQTAMRLIENIVEMLTPPVLFSHQQLREPRKQIINILCTLIDDQNQHVRWLVRRTLQTLMSHDGFEECLNADVEAQVLKRADRSLVLLQYNCDIG